MPLRDLIINSEVINALGPNGVVIHIARGSHNDEPELVFAFPEGRLGGAGLHVLEHEPDVPMQLARLDNCCTIASYRIRHFVSLSFFI